MERLEFSLPEIPRIVLQERKFPLNTQRKKDRRKRRVIITRCMTSNVPEVNQFERAGIVPYFYDEKCGENMYMFCIDDRWGQITDAGGGINPKEHFIHAGIRELFEESIGIFDFIEDAENVRRNSYAYYNKSMILLFQEVSIGSHDNLCNIFRRRYWHMKSVGASKKFLENSFIVWIPESHLNDICLNYKEVDPPENGQKLLFGKNRKYPKFYNKVFNFIKHVLSFRDGIIPK